MDLLHDYLFPADARKAPQDSEITAEPHEYNFKFFFDGIRITEILTNFSLGGKFFVF